MFKKFSAGAWIACCAAILALVSIILYNINIGREGYFQNASVTNYVPWCALALALLLLATAFGQAGNKVLDLLSGCCQIAAPALLAMSLINLVASRIEGLGFIYFSNADVLLEVQTPANLSSASTAITNMVVLGVAMLVAILSAFFTLRRKEAK